MATVPRSACCALQSEAYHDVRTYPLDVLGAETEGMIGYLLERELGNACRSATSPRCSPRLSSTRPIRRSAPDQADRAVYTQPKREELAVQRRLDDRDRTATVGGGSSPHRCHDRSSRRRRSSCCSTTTCWWCARGGGGIPVSSEPRRRAHGVEAVVDKDAATALLARNLGADLLLLLTDVPRWSSTGEPPTREPIREITGHELAASTNSPPGRWAPRRPRPRRL